MVGPNMASALLRTGSSKLLPVGLNHGLCKVPKNYNVVITQVACITGKAARADRPPRPPPFDWRNKEYRMWHVFTDPMEARLDDNSKIVVIEGLPASGKEKFAKQLAEELEMEYMPPPTFDDIHIDNYGFDYRSLNPKLPIGVQYYDDKMFHADPTGINSTAIQVHYYLLRLNRYIDALVHLFSTGQGVVLHRCPHSDIIFASAMFKSGYIKKHCLDYYKMSQKASLPIVLRPHLVIYLDIPSTVSMERIKRRGLPHEVKSKALTPKFLSDVEEGYKKNYLPDISKHAHLLMYDWTEEGDIQDIVGDIEHLEFDSYDRESEKMRDWDFPTWEARRALRGRLTDEREQILDTALPADIYVPEMWSSAEDNAVWLQLLEDLKDKYPNLNYDDSFNPKVDKDILWNMGRKHTWEQRQAFRQANLEKLKRSQQ